MASTRAALDVLSFPVDFVREKLQELVDGPGTLESARAFVAAVDWKDPLVLSILSLHALLLSLAVLTRESHGAQVSILALCFGLVRGGERLNRLASRWRRSESFGSPRYFDESGVFWSSLVSAPLLLIMLAQLVLFLRSAWNLMIELKVAQLRAAAGGEKRKERDRGGKKKTR